MSFIPSGSKMRVRKNSSRGLPETTSTSRPSTSTPKLYSQRSPGLKNNGTPARRLTLSSMVPSYGSRPCATFAAAYSGPSLSFQW